MKRHRSKSLMVTLSLIGLLAVSSGCGRAGGSGSAAEIDQLAQAPTQGTSDSTAQSSAAKGDALPDQNNPFPNRAPAPTLDGGVEWLNTSAPIDLKNLRGKFVVLDFWTYCCINCMHILPELKKLEKAYPNEVVVIGVHSAKFATEHDSKSITEAVLRYEIEHPVI